MSENTLSAIRERVLDNFFRSDLGQRELAKADASANTERKRLLETLKNKEAEFNDFRKDNPAIAAVAALDKQIEQSEQKLNELRDLRYSKASEVSRLVDAFRSEIASLRSLIRANPPRVVALLHAEVSDALERFEAFPAKVTALRQLQSRLVPYVNAEVPEIDAKDIGAIQDDLRRIAS